MKATINKTKTSINNKPFFHFASFVLEYFFSMLCKDHTLVKNQHLREIHRECPLAEDQHFVVNSQGKNSKQKQGKIKPLILQFKTCIKKIL